MFLSSAAFFFIHWQFGEFSLQWATKGRGEGMTLAGLQGKWLHNYTGGRAYIPTLSVCCNIYKVYILIYNPNYLT